jgi:hypothetical protein
MVDHQLPPEKIDDWSKDRDAPAVANAATSGQ